MANETENNEVLEVVDLTFEQLFAALFPHTAELTHQELGYLAGQFLKLAIDAKKRGFVIAEDFAGRLVRGLNDEATRRGHRDLNALFESLGHAINAPIAPKVRSLN